MSARDPQPASPLVPMADPARTATLLFRLSIGVFFIGGFVASSISLLVPRVRLAWGLGYGAASAIQFASFSSYLLFAFPAAALVARHGYMRANATGLAIMALGSTLLILGLGAQAYAPVLIALLALSTGATFLQIASNNAVTMAGDPRLAATRLNLLQGFNSLGTVVGPVLGASTLIPASGRVGSWMPALPFGLAALTLSGLALGFARYRDLLGGGGRHERTRGTWTAALRNRRLQGGALAIFAYVGAEVTIGALLTDFLMTRHASGWSPVAAARLVALYWGGAMVGRFAGAALLRRMEPAHLLAAAATLAPCLVLAALLGQGMTATVALLAVGIANSIMYPTIYVLALPPRAEEAPAGGMVLCIAVVGGAVVPLLTGLLADRVGLLPALLLPAACYLPVLAFGWASRASSSTELALTTSS
ncbi:MFS transporter [Sphingomonas paucimobilis]|uniref:MFS transporter n=1 Tax=Sphingomonas paucimobilis TaxID=13689 RepID=UPI0028D07287|nr:MFS transporter [Sphingomonas paucimobilis]